MRVYVGVNFFFPPVILFLSLSSVVSLFPLYSGHRSHFNTEPCMCSVAGYVSPPCLLSAGKLVGTSTLCERGFNHGWEFPLTTLWTLGPTDGDFVFSSSGSMEPAFHRGDLLFLTNFREDPIRAGEIVVFKVEGRDIPIVHRVIKVHEK